MNTKIIIAGLSVGLLAIGIYSYLGSSTAVVQEASSDVAQSGSVERGSSLNAPDGALGAAATASASRSSVDAGEYQYVQDRLAIMRERRPNRNYNPEEVAAAMARTNAWTPTTTPPTGLPLSQEELSDGREFIDFDSLKIETLVPGDTIKLPIGAADQEYEVKIDNVEVQDESRLAFSGHIEGYDGQSYYVSMNKGEVLTMGGIDTPDGHYTIQAHGNKGWIASSGALFKEHVDPIVPPTEVPPTDGQPTEGESHDGHNHSH